MEPVSRSQPSARCHRSTRSPTSSSGSSSRWSLRARLLRPGQVPTPVKLSDVATVELDSVATTGYARTNGNPSLTLTVTKTSDANTVQVAQDVEKALADAQAAHPGELTVTTVQNLSDFIVESQDGLLREGGLGALFAIITIFLFLFSVRSTLVAAISIPLSVLSALVLMQFAGITLNVLTLGGLAVAVGRVVDDAIVVLREHLQT